MSKPRDGAKEQFWRQALADWQGSGLSVSAFCQTRQLQPQSFFRWRKLLAQRDRPATAAADAPADCPAAPLFVPVRFRSPAAGAALPACEVVLRCGRLPRVAAGFDPTARRQLLAVLEQSPC